MPESYRYDRDPRRPSAARSSRPQGTRPQGTRPQGTRPQGTRPQGTRPQGTRPQGSRPAPRRRKKRVQPRFFIIAILLVVVVVAAIILFGGSKGNDPKQPMATPQPVTNSSGLGNATVYSQADLSATADPSAAAVPAANSGAQAIDAGTLADMLADSDTEVAALDEADRVQVTDLAVNASLPDSWINFLLLGTDERTLNESARTDSMIICSINRSTGEVKLASIMRDLDVKFPDAGKYSNTYYRINTANYFGGPNLAMKTVNECFDMNIQNYVIVNFYGFQKIASALGGIEVNITEAEMNEINKRAVEQAKIAYSAGIDETDLQAENVLLTQYGENVHLNGRQTLAYARIRKSDANDNDFSRAERQRTVLIKLMEKLKGKSPTEILALIASLSSNVTTNMDLNFIGQVAMSVLNNGISSVKTTRLPINGSYKEERRNNKDMFYDCDWASNALHLYNFIYE